MDVLIFQGNTYTRRNEKWVDARNMVVHEGLQKDLNREYAKQLDPAKLSLSDCVAHGDRFKRSSSMGLALRFYEEAARRADSETMAYLLPRISSCYRNNGQPKKAINTFIRAVEMFGEPIASHVFLVSVAAACCDIGDYDSAKKCCNKAYAKLNGQRSDELSLVYKRIQKATE